MKINEPVTQNEIPFPEGKVLASRTNLKGIITYTNHAFTEISGYSEEELMGSNHNLVRHPDMPPQAFEDLWNTLRQNKPWLGIVKNRAKNGDHYWVKATITPVLKNGRVVEYMSTRLQATRQEITEAEEFYRQLKDGTATLKKTTLQAWWYKLKSISITKKLLFNSIGLLVIFSLAFLGVSTEVIEGVVQKQESRQLNDYLVSIQDKIDSELRLASSMAALVAEMPVAHESFAKGDRDELIHQYLPAFKRLKDEFGVRQFQFHTPPAASYLRLHKPGKYGDDLTKKRPTIVLTNSSKKPVSGIDVGVFGLGLRGLTPVYNHGKHIGSVEFGMSFGQAFFDAIKQQYNIDVALELFDAGKLKPFASTLEQAVPVTADEIKRIQSGEKIIRYETVQEKPVAVVLAPVRDFADENIGVLQVIVDRTETLAQLSEITYMLSIAALVVILLGIILSLLLARGIIQPLQHAVSVINEIISGKYDNEIRINSDDEVGEVLSAMQIMQARQHFSIADTLEKAAEASRIQLALDNSSTPITVSNEVNFLVYMNKAAKKQLEKMESEWQKTVPHFKVNNMLGHKLMEYFDDPVIKQAYAEQFESEKVFDLQIAGRHMRLIANPSYDSHGNYAGRITQWLDRTEILEQQRREEERLLEERRIAAENERIKVALDNVSSNVMLANPEREIIYMNKSVERLFNEAESDIRKDLPNFNASTLLGSNIDSFHKKPGHQMRLLDQLSSTYQSELKVGGRIMRIIANPVIDADGVRLGTAVEWADRTQEVAIENEIDKLVEVASAGDLQHRLEVQDKKGFFLQLSTGFNSLLDQLTSVFNDIGDVMSHMAKGDLTHSITKSYGGTFGEVKDNINKTIANVDQTVEQLRTISEQVSTASGEILDGNNNLSARTEHQAANLEETAASMEELTSIVKNNSENAQEANHLANTACNAAERGGEVVNQAVMAMGQISESSNKIAEIIGAIDEIAFQTNLLALNASVEAARAGEQGRGFAVVATEVRNLASRSAEAAKEIKGLIKDSVEKVSSGSKLVCQTGESLNEIVDGVKKVGDIISEIATASTEQASGIEQINQAVTSLDEMTQQNAALAEEASAASASMSDNANKMQTEMSFFKTSEASNQAAPDWEEVSAQKESSSALKSSTQAMGSVLTKSAPSSDKGEEWQEF